MNISTAVLRRYIDLPDDNNVIRDLLDDVGIEVKRSSEDGAFTVELLANRGDHYCYDGIAREVSARTGGAVSTPTVATLTAGPSPMMLVLETDQCLVYTLTLLERDLDADPPDPNAETLVLDAETLAPLVAAGIHSVTAAVDATNLSNIEIGQPTHVFDADTVDGEVIIRLSRAGERAWPLFQDSDVALPEGTLIIADRSKVLAIAGVIGCEESKATASTRRILLESACFDPVSVRTASRALGVHTDSTARFERGSDPNRPLVGAGRVVHLLESQAGWRRVGTTGVVGAWTDPGRRVALDPAATAVYLGVDLSLDRITELLQRQGFARDGADARGWHAFRVPTWRLWDVEHTADLYEELAKAIGYANTPVTLPLVGRGAARSAQEVRKAQAEEVLLSHGFYEVFTDGFYGRSALDLLGVDSPSHPLAPHVETLNALDRDYSLLKNNALAQAVLAVDANLRQRTTDVLLYEWTRTFHRTAGIDRTVARDRHSPPCTERPLLWAIACGLDRPRAWADRSRPADVFLLKGILAELSAELTVPLTLGPTDMTLPLAGCLHPGRQAPIMQNNEVVGILGEVHPNVLKRARMKRGRPCYFELDAAALFATGSRPAYADPSAIQPIERSLAFGLPMNFEAHRVAALLRERGGDALTSVAITDRFDFEDDGQPYRAITFALRFENPDGTLSADAINTLLRDLQGAVEQTFSREAVRPR